MFFRSTNSKITPFWKPLTTHQSHRPGLQPWFCEMLPICVSVQFPRHLGHAFSQHWPAVLQGLLFSDGRWKLCGDQDAQGRQFFLSSLDLEWFWSPQNTDDFPPKTAVMIHSRQCLAGAGGLASVFVGHGNVWFMFHTYWNHVEVFLVQMGEFIHSVSTSSLAKTLSQKQRF